jgi:hypothetical protein
MNMMITVPDEELAAATVLAGEGDAKDYIKARVAEMLASYVKDARVSQQAAAVTRLEKLSAEDRAEILDAINAKPLPES